MRHVFLEVDRDSTIVSMLVMRNLYEPKQSKRNTFALKILTSCIAICLLLVYLGGSLQ